MRKKSQRKICVSILLLVSIAMFGLFQPQIPSIGRVQASSTSTAAGAVSWDPVTPQIGDNLTITYDTTVGSLSESATQVFMYWGIYIRGNQFFSGKTVGSVPPSPEMWPDGSVLVGPYRFIKTPMIDVGDGNWSVSTVINDKPDYLTCFFQDNEANSDNNGGNYYIIETQQMEHRISFLKPTFGEPLIITPSSEVTLKIEASEVATDWNLKMKAINGILEPTLSTNYTSEGLWEITFTAPAELGLYDMNISAQSGSYCQFDWEPNSLKVVSEFKESYQFIILGDPQFHRDGTAGYAYRNEKTGIGNFTDTLKEINIIDPEFVVVCGDITEWTDEIALENYRKWCDLYLDNVPMVSTIGNHGDFEGTAIVPGYYEWGTGQGMWENIIGPVEGIFYYGDHAFVRGDGHDRQFDVEVEDYNYVMEALDTISDNSMKYLILHHPLLSYDNPTGEIVQSETENTAIINKLKAIDADAFLHGHWHADKYGKTGNVHHIGTTEAVGDNPGYRIATVENSELISFSYEEPNAETYDAPSWPIDQINISYSDVNDGSLTSLSATVSNNLTKSLTDAHVRFQVSATEEYYQVTGGEIENTIVHNDIKIIDVVCDVASKSETIVSIEATEPPSSSSESSSESTSESTSESSSQPTETNATFSFLVLEFLFAVPILIYITKKKKR